MKVRDIIGSCTNDYDVYDNYTEELGIAYCNTSLTLEGKKKFSDVLNLNCELSKGIIIIKINELPTGEDDRLLELAKEMFEGMAGFCSVKDYKRYFIE